jgi:hypothetical protein
MAIKFDRVKPGMVLLDVHSYKVGNTTMRRLGCWEVLIVSVDCEKRTAQASWNGNPPTTYFRRAIERLYVNPPKAYRDQEGK